MFRGGLRSYVQVKHMATHASQAAPAGADATASQEKMSGLLEKLASITQAPAKARVPTGKQDYKKNRQNRNSDGRRDNASFNGNKRTPRRNGNNSQQRDNRNSQERSDRRGGYKSNSRTVQTVSHFDRIKNPKKTVAESSKSQGSFINEKGLSFAELQEQRAFYIRRKLQSESNIVPTTPEIQIFNFEYSRAVHKTLKYAPRENPFTSFKEPRKEFQFETVSREELELSKDKMGYDAKSRLLRALETICNRRGYKLLDHAKSNVQYLPLTANLYPFANTTLPNNLKRPHASLKSLTNVAPEEIKSTIESVVLGHRNELKFDEKQNFKTAQLRVNAQVVVNALNRNAQLQVDNLHHSIANVALGNGPVKSLPKAILPPKKV